MRVVVLVLCLLLLLAFFRLKAKGNILKGRPDSETIHIDVGGTSPSRDKNSVALKLSSEVKELCFLLHIPPPELGRIVWYVLELENDDTVVPLSCTESSYPFPCTRYCGASPPIGEYSLRVYQEFNFSVALFDPPACAPLRVKQVLPWVLKGLPRYLQSLERHPLCQGAYSGELNPPLQEHLLLRETRIRVSEARPQSFGPYWQVEDRQSVKCAKYACIAQSLPSLCNLSACTFLNYSTCTAKRQWVWRDHRWTEQLRQRLEQCVNRVAVTFMGDSLSGHIYRAVQEILLYYGIDHRGTWRSETLLDSIFLHFDHLTRPANDSSLRRVFCEPSVSKGRERVVVVNVGLWPITYLSLVDYTYGIHRLARILQTISDRVLWRTTTAVHSSVAERPRFQISPRVDYFNSIATGVMMSYGIEVVDLFPLTLGAKMYRRDNAHYCPPAMMEGALVLLERLC